MGRTGTWFAHQHWPVQPDIVTLAKALAGGIACGGLIARPEVAQSLKPGTHAATFGGNPVACAAALATIETIESDGLLARAVEIENRFRKRIEALMVSCPWVTEYRGRGTMIGIQLAVEGAPVVKACMERRLLINCTHNTVIRLLPSLTLTDEELDRGCAILEEELARLGQTAS
jgi:acetylornithine/succinyldiaminopimelate/putrescine aminotransferase